ncbi:MAG: prenyltransferase/squalene oxidase repeat-containing protein [Pirellulales bacterium]
MLMLVGWLSLTSISSAQKYSPEHPRVQALVGKGLAYLEANGRDEPRLGGMSLIGLALYKAGKPESHPLIQRAVAECRQVARNLNKDYSMEDYPSDAIYNLGLAVVFLCELDPEKYRPEIKQIFGWLLRAQKDSGGWGYPVTHSDGAKHADTSMSQYVALACWSVRRYGATEVPDDVVRRLTKWLLRTQDPSGGWGYQGIDPGLNVYQRTAQEEVRISLVAAALGSVYVCSDLLNISTKGLKGPAEYPPSLRRVDAQASNRSAGPGDVPVKLVRQSLEDGREWLYQNFRIDPDLWTHYYLYALERAQSFAEAGAGGADKRFNWYDQGVEYLAKTQSEDGHWFSGGGNQVDTAFSILFLLRSTRRSIEKAAAAYDGLLRGGRGLPSDTEEIQVQNGRVVRSELSMQADALLDVLEDDDFRNSADLLAAEYDIQLSDNRMVRGEQIKRLGHNLRSESQAVRLAAVRVLISQRDLNSVPDLIYALSDPDAEVVQAADEGLRAISRQPDAPRCIIGEPPEQRAKIAQYWRDWYQGIRPGESLQPSKAPE